MVFPLRRCACSHCFAWNGAGSAGVCCSILWWRREKRRKEVLATCMSCPYSLSLSCLLASQLCANKSNKLKKGQNKPIRAFEKNNLELFFFFFFSSKLCFLFSRVFRDVRSPHLIQIYDITYDFFSFRRTGGWGVRVFASGKQENSGIAEWWLLGAHKNTLLMLLRA